MADKSTSELNTYYVGFFAEGLVIAVEIGIIALLGIAICFTSRMKVHR